MYLNIDLINALYNISIYIYYISVYYMPDISAMSVFSYARFFFSRIEKPVHSLLVLLYVPIYICHIYVYMHIC